MSVFIHTCRIWEKVEPSSASLDPESGQPVAGTLTSRVYSGKCLLSADGLRFRLARGEHFGKDIAADAVLSLPPGRQQVEIDQYVEVEANGVTHTGRIVGAKAFTDRFYRKYFVKWTDRPEV